MGGRIGEDLESDRQQSVARQDRGRFVESLVHRRPPAPQVVVIHGGQVIVYERVAMDAFERAGCIQRLIRADAEQGRALDHEEGPEALAAAERAISHRFEQPRRNRAKAFPRQPIVEVAFNTACMSFEAFCKGHGKTANLGAGAMCARTMDQVSVMLKRDL